MANMELDAFLDNPECLPNQVRRHRTSRVEVYPDSAVFPLMEAKELCERKAERRKNLYEILKETVPEMPQKETEKN